jgi:predicted metal-binding protein
LSTRAELIACETCGGNDRDAEGRPRGERLLALLRDAAADSARIHVSSVRCLWACKRSCAVHVRSAERVGYVLGELEPTPETARALLDYAALYEQSPDGAVPFRQWPVLLKGHFICRTPAPAPLNALAVEGRGSAHEPRHED